MRIGHGFDVHALVEGRACIIGGIDIPYPKGLLGHSDADVVAHALMDALLSAARLGDIGVYFPPSDPSFAGASSLVLLSQVATLVRKAGFEIEDCDCTIAAEAPRLTPYRDDMRRNLADAMTIDWDRVGIKATTTEGLGFVGKGEGIAAWACVLLVEKPHAL